MDDPGYAIGIMSGTSVDGVDAVLLELADDRPPRVIETSTTPFPAHLRDDILQLTQPGDNEIDLAGRVHIELGELYASVAASLVTDRAAHRVSVIGCHGQTVRHRPEGNFPFTLQLGSGAVIAARTGVTTITDFRSADIAEGGQGAPFAPFFHNAMFRSSSANRAIVNLGGIANVTVLPADQSAPVTGFDSGPGNGLMDAWIQRHRQQPFDRHGAWAAGGQIDQALLDGLLAHPYLHRSGPRSTGREDFHIGWLDQVINALPHSVSPRDVQRTLAEFTARTVVDQAAAKTGTTEIYICGGGSDNRLLMERINQLSDAAVQSTAKLGIAPTWIEAAAFAWMASQTLRGAACSIPSVTGARLPTITGAIYPANPR